MWGLIMTNAAKGWVEAGGFEMLIAAARREHMGRALYVVKRQVN
jgi:hypothetical protein